MKKTIALLVLALMTVTSNASIIKKNRIVEISECIYQIRYDINYTEINLKKIGIYSRAKKTGSYQLNFNRQPFFTDKIAADFLEKKYNDCKYK